MESLWIQYLQQSAISDVQRIIAEANLFTTAETTLRQHYHGRDNITTILPQHYHGPDNITTAQTTLPRPRQHYDGPDNITTTLRQHYDNITTTLRQTKQIDVRHVLVADVRVPLLKDFVLNAGDFLAVMVMAWICDDYYDGLIQIEYVIK